MRTARQMAMIAAAAQLPTTTETDGAAVSTAATNSAAVGGTTAGLVQTVKAVHPALMQAPIEQPAVMRKIAPQSGELLLAAYARVHRAWEQH